MDINIIKIAGYYEIKGTFTIETRKENNSLRPVINLSTRHSEICYYISKVFKEYDLKHSIIKRVSLFDGDRKFYNLRISNKKNVKVFVTLFDNFFTIKRDEYLKIKNHIEH